MTYRKSDHPLIAFVYVTAAFILGGTIGLHHGAKVRQCPARLADGRPLLGIVLSTNECKYSGVPRPAVELSSTELRRIAITRDRMEKVRQRVTSTPGPGR